MSPLESMMRPLARLLNRNIQDSIEARALCDKLDGQVVAVGVRDTGLTIYFVIENSEIDLRMSTERDPDAAVTGSLIGLASMAAGGGEDMIRSGSIELTGDALTAQAFQKLLERAKPDIEEELSGVIGDSAAYRAGELARGLSRWSKSARETMGQNVREYLQEEARELPSRSEVESFSNDVNTLRDDVERLAAKVQRLKDQGR
ncbi:MAG: SCP2 sterol-binding domain-containing protein [Woeseiaceae bacterium]|nr:SCP2 sterol-binding domain-containing protein [Woeseiaceae bacterium]